jgi:hypothetical protein
MRFCVKPHSGILAFFLSKRGPAALAIGHLAIASLVLRSWHSFSPAALPSPVAGGERRGRKNAVPRLHPSSRGSFRAKASSSAGVCYGPSDTPGQPSIRVALLTNANTSYLVRSRRTGRPWQSPPIERTAPWQDTRRQNGDSVRLAWLAARTLAFLAYALGSAGWLTPRRLASRDAGPSS